ncbi:MAG: type II toxin-antitoxin system VapB family antitoxin [Candidatus Poribacteria bacterium]|nr:type II toxin-antitoxin system VapB family antitoxin [Candidatus Poribacteria bacterium]
MQKLVSIRVNDDLIKKVMEITGTKTKRAAAEEALRRIARGDAQQKALEKLRGIGWGWTDDPRRELDEMRTNKRDHWF